VSAVEFTDQEFVVNKRTGHVLPRIVCADGFALSVQASEYHYCTPREDTRYYLSVEVGFPTERPEPWDEWSRFAESGESPTDTVYGWVPAPMVRDLIALHGGAA